MSLFTLADAVMAEVGLLMPPRLVDNPDPDARRILACAAAEGEHLYRVHAWSILQREDTITTVAQQDNYPVPDDFGRLTIRTAWDRAQYWQMRGSLTAQQWQHQKSALIATLGLQRHFRQIVGPQAGSLLLHPVPTTAGQELVYEYTSRNWCESAAGVGQNSWQADSDELRIDHDLFRQGLLWRVKRANGHAYADERNDAEMAVKRAIVADVAMEPFELSGCPASLLPNIPEGSWGV